MVEDVHDMQLTSISKLLTNSPKDFNAAGSSQNKLIDMVYATPIHGKEQMQDGLA